MKSLNTRCGKSSQQQKGGIYQKFLNIIFSNQHSIIKYKNYNAYSRFFFVNSLLNRFYKKFKEKGGRISVLDVGGGEGYFGIILDKTKFDYFLIDISKNKVRIASEEGINSKWCRGYKLPFKDNSFDVVLCIHTLEHIKEEESREKLCKELIRISRKSVILSFPVRSSKRFEKIGVKILKKLGKNISPDLKDHLIFKSIKINKIKKIFKDSEVLYSGNMITWLFFLFIKNTIPFLMFGLILIFDPLFRFFYKIGPYRDTVIIYHKDRKSIH